MKNTTMRFTAILMMLGAFAALSFGQKTERVKFDKGATSGTFTRTIPANGSMDFIINAKARQYMDYTVAYDFKKTDIEAFLTEPDLQDVSQTPTIDARNVFKTNTGGDHRLTVNNMTRKSVTITLYLQITNNDPDVDDEDMSSDDTEGFERLDFTNKSEVKLSMQLDVGETRQFVTYLTKGASVCTSTDKNYGSKVLVEVDTVSVSGYDGCTQGATKAGDQNINFTNQGNKKMSFTVVISTIK